jgi:hypothetical protein
MTLKNTLFLVFSALAAGNQLTAQQTIDVVFEDNTKMQFTLIESRGEQMNRNWIYNGFGGSDMGQLSTLGFQHFHAGVFSAGIEAHIQPFLFIPEKLGKIGLEGTYYFKSFQKQKPRYVTLSSSYAGANTTVKYRAKVDEIFKDKYLGAQLEVSNNTYINSDYDLSAYRVTKATAIAIAPGFSFTSTAHIKIGFDNNPKKSRQGTTYFRALANVIFYPSQTVESELRDPQPGVDYAPFSNDEVFSSKVGFRALLDGHTSVWGRSEWGINYQLGVMKTPFLLRSGGSFAPLVRLGIYVGFGDPK